VSIFDDGYHQAILDVTHQPIDKPPAGFMEVFSPAMTPTATRLEHQWGQNNETRAALRIIHLQPQIAVILPRSKRGTPKKTGRCL
jgi:hypothetical protein